MASKIPDNRKASPMEHVHVRLPNLRNQVRSAAKAGEESVAVSAEAEATTTEITTAKKGR